MNNEEVSFQIIASVGEAKACFIEAIRAAVRGDLDEARSSLAAGEEAFQKGHAVHGAILREFASGNPVETDILLVHAECQMMSAEDFSVMAQQVIDIKEECEEAAN